ncbi:uncharacterized protein LOC109789378 [Cajanus cajan]|uniref:uncharacterized protein LOC109789378 n=1 Tax=Cajanus cajan TaxID=3821 RepID=UPI00098D79B9|nr:uncharacterized protein LOC109789378 [Cajanus cajan]
MKEEMTAMKQQRERDAPEMAALREENAALKNQYRDPTWKPSETTTLKGRSTRTAITPSPTFLSLPQLPMLRAADRYNHCRPKHIDIPLLQVTLSTTDDAALCRIFPTSLKGRALSWFTRLPANSVDSFNTLSSQFTIQLALIALHHLTTALKPGPFANNICKKPPTDMDDLRRRADKYMQMEELAEFRNQARAEIAAKADKPAESNYRSRPKEISREKPARGPRYSHYTSLNASRSAVLDQALALEQGQLQRFVDRPRSPRRDDHRHRGEQHGRERSDRHPHRERSRSRDRREVEPTTQPRRVINTITGGFAGGGSTSSAQKRHLRAVRTIHAVECTRQRLPAITFTEADFKGIDPDQDNPMVISVEIHNCIVRKTLVDQGSSADILYWNTFKQLGIPEAELIPYNEPLVGFSGERVQTKGYIKLSTRFCSDGPEVKDIPIKYVVVHANTSYNILLGRPSLNRLGAIVSTPHLAMKFPSESGRIITVHVDQKVARECYFASLWLPRLGATEPSREKRVHSVAQDLETVVDRPSNGAR